MADGLKAKFDEARKAFPGTKRGLDVEWEDFRKKHDPAAVVPLLLPAIVQEIDHKMALKEAKQFCPEWAHFKTWLNQQRWTQELGQVNGGPPMPGDEPQSGVSSSKPYDPLNP